MGNVLVTFVGHKNNWLTLGKFYKIDIQFLLVLPSIPYILKIITHSVNHFLQVKVKYCINQEIHQIDDIPRQKATWVFAEATIATKICTCQPKILVTNTL